jgi:hypothetical protein
MKNSLITLIPPPVLVQFGKPKIQFGLGLTTAAWVLMPKTTVYENDLVQSRKDHIRNSREISRVQAIPEPHCVHYAPHSQLGFCIRAPHAGHAFTALLF